MSTLIQPAHSLIFLSDAAKRHFQHQLANRPLGTCLRLTLKKTGCSGLSYTVEFVNEPSPTDLPISHEGKLPLYLDSAHVLALSGLRIDFVKQGLNKKLIFDNPNETGRCGCGESFTVK